MPSQLIQNGGLPYIIGEYGEFHKSNECICNQDSSYINQIDTDNKSKSTRLCFCDKRMTYFIQIPIDKKKFVDSDNSFKNITNTLITMLSDIFKKISNDNIETIYTQNYINWIIGREQKYVCLNTKTFPSYISYELHCKVSLQSSEYFRLTITMISDKSLSYCILNELDVFEMSIYDTYSSVYNLNKLSSLKKAIEEESEFGHICLVIKKMIEKKLSFIYSEIIYWLTK